MILPGPQSPLLSLLALTPCVHTFLDMCAGEAEAASVDAIPEITEAEPEDWGQDYDVEASDDIDDCA